MGKLLLIGIIGFLAQMIDGALGMAYGVSSTTLLLAIGSAPAVASATVHLAEVGTVAVSAVSHWRFGNVEWRTVRLMTLPGFIGAFLGAVTLSSLSAETAEPWMAGFLFLLGIYVLVRFSLRRRIEDSWIGARKLLLRSSGAWSRARSSARSTRASSSCPWAPRSASFSRSAASGSRWRGSRRCWPAA